MHRAEKFMEDSAEFILAKMQELDNMSSPHEMMEVAEMAEGFNEMYDFLCNAKKLMSTDYDMEHYMHGGHDMDHDWDGNQTAGAKHMYKRGAYSEARRRHATHDGDYDAEGHMTEEARLRRAHHMGAEHYEGEAVGYDAHGNKVHYKGEAEVHKNLR